MPTYFYPRSPCGERRAYSLPSSTISTISIHALLAESDDADRAALCERCIFLSTLSLRRATGSVRRPAWRWWHFYPRSPCGERPPGKKREPRYPVISIHALLAESDPRVARVVGEGDGISIHALLAESDLLSRCWRPSQTLFLSTLSLRRATIPRCRYVAPKRISIHALLAESDQPGLCCHYGSIFLSTLSLRRATCAKHRIPIKLRFLSTLSLRRATYSSCVILPYPPISIHALLAESDGAHLAVDLNLNLFLSTLSLRRATPRAATAPTRFCKFLSTLSLRRATYLPEVW